MRLLRLTHRYLVRQTFPSPTVPYYDRMIDAVRDVYLRGFCQRILDRSTGPTVIVDAGSGPGHLAVMLGAANPDYTVTGIDLSSRFVRMARERAEAEGLAGRVNFQRGDLEACPGPVGSTDLVVSTCSLHHWRRPAKVLRALKRLLKPSGQIWLMDDSADATEEAQAAWVAAVEEAARVGWLFRTVFRFEIRHLAYTRDEVVRLCTRAGLDVLDFRVEGVFFSARTAPARGGRTPR